MAVDGLAIALFDAETGDEIEGPGSSIDVAAVPEVGARLHIWIDRFTDRTDDRRWDFEVKRVIHDLRLMDRNKVVHTACLYVSPCEPMIP